MKAYTYMISAILERHFENLCIRNNVEKNHRKKQGGNLCQRGRPGINVCDRERPGINVRVSE